MCFLSSQESEASRLPLASGFPFQVSCRVPSAPELSELWKIAPSEYSSGFPLGFFFARVGGLLGRGFPSVVRVCEPSVESILGLGVSLLFVFLHIGPRKAPLDLKIAAFVFATVFFVH